MSGVLAFRHRIRHTYTNIPPKIVGLKRKLYYIVINKLKLAKIVPSCWPNMTRAPQCGWNQLAKVLDKHGTNGSGISLRSPSSWCLPRASIYPHEELWGATGMVDGMVFGNTMLRCSDRGGGIICLTRYTWIYHFYVYLAPQAFWL